MYPRRRHETPRPGLDLTASVPLGEGGAVVPEGVQPILEPRPRQPLHLAKRGEFFDFEEWFTRILENEPRSHQTRGHQSQSQGDEERFYLDGVSYGHDRGGGEGEREGKVDSN